MNAGPELIAALDFPARGAALRMARKLRGTAPWVKVGMELFTAEGPRIVRGLKALDFKVFLDIKLHDIPNTVRGAVLAACRLQADMLTLHLSGGERMIRAAVDAAEKAEHRPLLFGVTILTSIAPGELPGFKAQSRKAFAAAARKLALQAQNWGMDGIVCSGHEVRGIKRAVDLLCLTPGIRPDGNSENSDDQRRTVTPFQAAESGADFLVVGRPITAAPDPAGAARNILNAARHGAGVSTHAAGG